MIHYLKGFPPTPHSIIQHLRLVLLADTAAILGIDAGFDMFPPLSQSAEHKENWESFIETVKNLYEGDDIVEIKPNYIEFKVAEHPLLPFEGHKFLRFSSKISGRQGKEVERYIYVVRKAAEAPLDSQVQSWNEMCDTRGNYSWEEINTSIKSYEQVCQSRSI